MTDEMTRQRIRWLVEHGELIADPLTEIRREVRLVRWGVVGGVLVLVVIGGALILS